LDAGHALANRERSLTAEIEGLKLGASATATAETFVDVFRAYGAYVLGLLRRFGVREADVEDVAQEVFVVVHAQLAGFEGRSTLKTWICGICVRKVSEYRRKAHRRHEIAVAVVPERETLSDQQEVQLEQKQQAELLQRGLSRLSEKQLQVFVLYEIEELSMAEVARALGCPRFTAYTRLHAARRAMRAFLERAATVPTGRRT
jgi:RNA polymerase sigma-70 factor (ECF subfamily)